MNKKISFPTVSQAGQWILIFLTILLVRHTDADSLLIPLIGLCAGGDDGGSCGCGNAGDPGLFSTPFLCTWNGTKYVFENDILFGKPSSIFPTEQAGRSAYERGLIMGDLYKINNRMVVKNGVYSFQIKEVEPEESYIDSLSLLRVRHPKNSELVVNASFEDFLVFDTTALEEREGVSGQSVQDQTGADISEKFVSRATALQVMHTGDTVEIIGKVENKNSPLYFLMGSHYRDWTLGDIFEAQDTSFVKSRIANIFSESHSMGAFVSGATKVIGLVVLLGAVWVVGTMQGVLSWRGTNDVADAGKLASVFGMQAARADIVSNPRSLVVEYLDAGTYHQIDVIQPRYYQKTLEALCIPPQAVQKSGLVTIRVRATKRHHVAYLSLVAPKKLLPFQVETFGVSRAFHHREQRDYAQVLNEKKSQKYLHTIPADVVDIEFGASSQAREEDIYENESYLIQAQGFYTPLSDESRHLAGDWVPKLDPEAREWLGNMYALKDYAKEERTTVL